MTEREGVKESEWINIDFIKYRQQINKLRHNKY